jgi:hypothetical protein
LVLLRRLCWSSAFSGVRLRFAVGLAEV